MKTWLILLCVGALTMQSAQGRTLKILHYNIKELDSYKINHNDAQIAYVKKILNQKKFDFLSLNEIQYDRDGIPSQKFKTTGRNLEKLRKLLHLPHLRFESFYPANTGELAKKKADGTYFISPNSPEARSYADPLNFGVMPGQYSTGALSNYKIVKEHVIKDLRWKDFNPKADFSKFKTEDGQEFPDDMKLFDKNFSDLTIDVDGIMVHIILLHTVPSYHFGNPHSINMYRNSEQLKFLEWYLTGNTDFDVKLTDITPLNKTDRFIAMGDFNVSVNEEEADGAKVLNRLFGKINTWIKKEKMDYTNEGSSFAPNPSRFMLDYIITSKNIKPLHGEIMQPDVTREELGCNSDELTPIQNKNKFTQVEYQAGGKTCYAKITKDYYHFKMASDHFPLYGEFQIK